MHLKGLGNLVDGFPFFQQSQSQSLLFFELLRPPELDPEAGCRGDRDIGGYREVWETGVFVFLVVAAVVGAKFELES